MSKYRVCDYNNDMRNLARIKEKDGIRGLVPSRKFGIQDRVYGSYLNTLNPRGDKNVQDALATCPDPRFKEFLARISEPRFKRISLQAIAKACSIDLKEFQTWWQRESTQRAIAIAQTKSIEVTEDMVEDARTSDDVCPRCDGLGFVAAPIGLPKGVPGYRQIEAGAEPKYIRTCPKCESGKVRKPGDAHARDRIMEMAGIIQRGKSAVTLVQNFGGASHSSAITQLDDAMTITVDAEHVD